MDAWLFCFGFVDVAMGMAAFSDGQIILEGEEEVLEIYRKSVHGGMSSQYAVPTRKKSISRRMLWSVPAFSGMGERIFSTRCFDGYIGCRRLCLDSTMLYKTPILYSGQWAICLNI